MIPSEKEVDRQLLSIELESVIHRIMIDFRNESNALDKSSHSANYQSAYGMLLDSHRMNGVNKVLEVFFRNLRSE